MSYKLIFRTLYRGYHYYGLRQVSERSIKEKMSVLIVVIDTILIVCWLQLVLIEVKICAKNYIK